MKKFWNKAITNVKEQYQKDFVESQYCSRCAMPFKGENKARMCSSCLEREEEYVFSRLLCPPFECAPTKSPSRSRPLAKDNKIVEQASRALDEEDGTKGEGATASDGEADDQLGPLVSNAKT